MCRRSIIRKPVRKDVGRARLDLGRRAGAAGVAVWVRRDAHEWSIFGMKQTRGEVGCMVEDVLRTEGGSGRGSVWVWA
jgi:hypothetical protein